ncbi:MAG: hypothetical protein Q8M57_11430 [Nitrosomonas sp.]|uniref:hypothetical protein n=1 Tax=Nitrosomonas sp. TaxID=42353 RepID=UPI002731FBAA|nr:hypothetical protein [Nitrosomonas sp.]MDP2225567.1 hypothetical protein [Nitrosomonas sp.]MDP3281636.1 hypothetical protein [Nitrosomonas sp.]
MKYRERFTKCLINPTEEEILERDPLLLFSFYLAGRVNVLCVIGDEILENLDKGFSAGCIDSGRIDRAESFMWLWILGAYEVVRTMHQAKQCFSERLTNDLQCLKKSLATVRMPAAKMEKPGTRAAVTSNRSPNGWDIGNRDLLINDPDESVNITVRNILKEFDGVFCSITKADVLANHETTYSG